MPIRLPFLAKAGVLALSLVLAGSAFAEKSKSPGIVFQDTFSRVNASGWRGPTYPVIKNGELYVEAAAGGNNTFSQELPVDGLGGGTLLISAMVRTESVSARPKPWNGIKLMLAVKTDSDVSSYPQATVGEGTFARQRINFVADVPRDVSTLTLIAGLENVTGKVWFSDIQVRLITAAVADGDVVPAKVGAEIFALDLKDPGIRAQLESQGGVITNNGPGGTPAVRFIVDPATNASLVSAASFKLDVRPLFGSKVALSALVRGENIRNVGSDKPLPGYLGGKCQILFESPSSGKRWLDSNDLHGTFDWREATLMGGVGKDETAGTLRIGLEKAAGTIWVTDLKVRVIESQVVRPAPSPAARAAVASARTTLRGFMSSHTFNVKDFDDLAAMKANVVRWQMYPSPTEKKPYDEWLAGKLDELALALDAVAARGIKIAIDLHGPPGGRVADRTYRMYLEKAHADRFVAIWRQIATRFKSHPGLWAYDLVNEPVQNTPSPRGLDNWLELQVRAARAIRAIDAVTPIMIETDGWCAPEAFAWLQPIDIPGLIYQAHMYWPGEYTHQGVRTDQGVADGKNLDSSKIVYPGTLHGKPFDKEALRKHLQPVRDFQLATGAPIYIGEFSVIRWAPGGARYLDDLISIFEEYGWDWSYHAFREWPGWSVEHADEPYDRNRHVRCTEPTERMKVIQKWLDKNPPLVPAANPAR